MKMAFVWMTQVTAILMTFVHLMIRKEFALILWTESEDWRTESGPSLLHDGPQLQLAGHSLHVAVTNSLL